MNNNKKEAIELKGGELKEKYQKEDTQDVLEEKNMREA